MYVFVLCCCLIVVFAKMFGEEFEEYVSALSEFVINSKLIIILFMILVGEIVGNDEV